MLQRDETGGIEKAVRVFGFLIGVEIEEGTDVGRVALALADATRFMEGVGDATVDILGEVEVVDGPEYNVTETEWGPLTGPEGEC